MSEIILIVLFILLLFWSFGYLEKNISIPTIISLLFIYVFFFGLLQYFKLPDFLIKFSIDIFFILLIIGLLSPKNKHYPGIRIFILFTALFFFSVVLNSSDLYHSLTFYRIFLYPYLLFLVLYNYNFSEKQRYYLNKLIIYLFIIQIFFSIFKFIFIGPSEKILVGSISIDGGVFSTIFPLFAIAFLFSLFVIYKSDKKYLLYSIGFLLMGYVGAKRGVWLYLIILIIFGFYYLRKINAGKFLNKRLLSKSLIVLALSIVALGIGVRYTPTLNPEMSRGSGTIDLSHITTYALDYTFNVSEFEDKSFGRGANFLTAGKHLISSNAINILFGFGPDVAKGTVTYGEGIWGEFGIYGPATGLTRHMIQLGVPAVIIILLVFYGFGKIFLSLAKVEQDPWRKSIAFGGLLVTVLFFLDYLTYSSAYITTLFPLSFSYVYVLALIFKRKKSLIFSEYNK